MTNIKTAVVGLDGAHFELLEPWFESGDLPHIQRVLEMGISANLRSVLPPVTSPNWKAYSTGKNPGKIGIFWWENIDTERRRVYYPSNRKHANTEYWEIIAADESVGVLGVPTTYPPKDVGAFLVAGAPDGENEGFAYPGAVEQELLAKFDYRVNNTHRLKDYPEKAAEEIIDLIDLRFSAAKHLAKEYDIDFLQVTTFYINSLHHFFWDDEYTHRAWQIIDGHVGDLLDTAENVILMSDHGSNEIQTVFHVNSWLEQEGYLSLAIESRNLFYRLGINTDRILRVATRFGVRDPAERIAPQWLLNQIPNEDGEFKREQKTDVVDWANTQVIASGQGPVYLTMARDDPGYESLRSELIESLRSLTDPGGRPIAINVYRGEHLYSGPYLTEAPDIVIDQAPGVHIPGNIGSETVFSTPESGWKAENKKHGLFAATGPAFAESFDEELSILDLAPTILHLHGCAVPDDMDGSVRTDLFAPDSPAAVRPVEKQTISVREREVDRIQGIARRLAD